MKNVKIILPLAALAVVISGCMGAAERKAYAQHLEFFRTKTELIVKEACTNDAPGLTRIISINLNEASKDVNKWNADATVEFLNKAGSLEQQKLEYNFVDTGNDINCFRKY